MAKKFLTPIDLNQLELQNARLQNLATAPSSPVKGQMYYNTTSNKALVWDGTAWVPWEVGGVTGVKGNSESTYRTGNVNLTAANIGAAASSHAHGNITSGGDITETAPTIASGDQIIINDHSASKITNGPTFDGSTTTKALTPKGTWETFNNYSHPTYTANTAAAVKVGNDATGHVVIGAALAKGDVGLGNVDNTADANKTVNKANQLTTARNIDGISFNGSSGVSHFRAVELQSSVFTYDSTNNRCVINVSNAAMSMDAGSLIYISFTNINKASGPSSSGSTPVYLRLSAGTPKPIYYSDNTSPNNSLTQSYVVNKFYHDATYLFVFSNNYCHMVGEVDTDTTYSTGTNSELTTGTVTDNRVWTPKILHDYIASAIGGADAMRFKGTIGTGGDVTSLPTTGVKVGDTYRVITAGTYAGQACEIGDLIIATATTPTWTVAQTNIDGAITSISGTAPISVTGSGNSRTVAHSNSGVTAASKGDTSNQTPGWGSTFKALSGTVNATGHLTAFAEHTVKIPDTVATTTTAGLMSASDKQVINNLFNTVSINAGSTSKTLSGIPLSYTAYRITGSTYEQVELDVSVSLSNMNEITTTFSIASAITDDIIILASLYPL